MRPCPLPSTPCGPRPYLEQRNVHPREGQDADHGGREAAVEGAHALVPPDAVGGVQDAPVGAGGRHRQPRADGVQRVQQALAWWGEGRVEVCEEALGGVLMGQLFSTVSNV